jgi:proline iminopeptidase
MSSPSDDPAGASPARSVSRVTGLRTSLRPALANARITALVAGAVAIGGGLVSDQFAARGPVTPAQALGVMLLVLAIGGVGGALTRSRWVLPLVALGYMIGVELGRLTVTGASLELRLDNAYGVIAFMLTRGLHGLLFVLPLLSGVLVGIRWANARDGRPGRHPVGLAAVGVASLVMVVLVASPGSTPPVTGTDGRPIAGSIAELARIPVGGTEQTVMIRAASPDRPVILWLAGGPGQSDLALARAQIAGWEQDFVVAALDQRGNGTSYAAIDPVAAMTLDRAVSDVIEVTDYLRARFDEQKIYLMGESWGTILGVLAVERRPDLYHAWIGSGQMVDVVETDERVYADLLAYAERAGDQELLAGLRAVGEPPYRDIPWANSNLLAWYEHLYADYTPSDGYLERGARSGLDPFGVLGSEYSFIDKANVLRGLIDTFAVLYPQLYAVDLRERASQLEVPVYVLDGAAELRGRRDLALEWFERLDAPVKELVTYEGAAHATAFEQGDAVQRLLNEVIVPATYGK